MRWTHCIGGTSYGFTSCVGGAGSCVWNLSVSAVERSSSVWVCNILTAYFVHDARLCWYNSLVILDFGGISRSIVDRSGFLFTDAEKREMWLMENRKLIDDVEEGPVMRSQPLI